MLKILQKSETAVEYVNKNPQLFRFIEQWCKEYAHFPLNQQKKKIFRQGQVMLDQLKNVQINQPGKPYLILNSSYRQAVSLHQGSTAAHPGTRQ